MKVLVIGNGAREHAISWKLAQSPKVSQLFVAPGNAGTAMIADNIPIKADDIPALVKSILTLGIDLTVVGPEVPLAGGIVNQLVIRGLDVFGPTRAAAEIETSKVFAKAFMHRHKIPTASSMSFSDYQAATSYIQQSPLPLVIKADGLSQGKGVIIASTCQEAKTALDNIMLKQVFGQAGNSVVIEELLTGRELSAFAFTDPHFTSPVITACDYKRIFDGDQGPNTGGMGSYSPPEFYNQELGDRIYNQIMQPVVELMHDEGRPFKGMLYGGLMLTDQGLKVLEFNARFGDPETQVILPRLDSDLAEIMLAVSNNRLKTVEINWSQEACVGVVMASGGYPGNYDTGFPITGLDEVDKDIMVFHAGTALDNNGQVITSGGRVLTVAAKGTSLAEARQKVYSNIGRIKFQGCYWRNDIALPKNNRPE